MRAASKNIAIWNVCFTALAVVIGCLSSSVLLRGVAVSPLIFLLPGYSVLRAMGERRLNLQTLVFSVGLSISFTVLGGIVLNSLGALSTAGWAALLGAISISASLIPKAAIPRRSIAEYGAAVFGVRPVHLMMYVAAVSMGVGAIAVARAGADHQHQYEYSEFWMIPGKASNANLVTVGIRNAENVRTIYEIALFADDANIGRRSGIALQPGETWSEILPLNGKLGHADRVEARLFRSDAPDSVYRKVWLANVDDTAKSKKDQK